MTRLLILLSLLLAACDRKEPAMHIKDGKGAEISVKQTGEGDGSARIEATGDGMSMNLPGFSADMNIPGLKIGSDKMDLDGIKVHPGTKLSGMDIDGSGDGGTVHIRFTDPAAPAVLAEHYKREAASAGYIVDSAGPERVAAHKDDADHSRLDIVIGRDGGGSSGTIMLTGK